MKDINIFVRKAKLEGISWITDSHTLQLVSLSDTPTHKLTVLHVKSLVGDSEIPGVQTPKKKIKSALEAELAALPVIKAAHSFP